MIQAYKDKKDLYAVIASKIYHNNYEDNREFFPDGTMNPEGKRRRTNVKSLLLGIMYGLGSASMAEKIKTHKGPTTKEDLQAAQKIIDDFFKEFPNVKKWIDETKSNAEKYGYVEDCWGRRRRLPDLQLNKYEIKFKNGKSPDTFNPLLYSKGLYTNTNMKLVEKYNQLCNNCTTKKDLQAVKDQALKEGIEIKDNGGYIAQAERQCVNARVQGGAASMSKRAMIAVHNDEELKDLGFKLLIAVHDELIGECPIENQEEVKKRLSYLMIESAKPECIVPMKCDADSFPSWYWDVYESNLKEEYTKLLEKYPKDRACNMVIKEHEELLPEQIVDILKDL